MFIVMCQHTNKNGERKFGEKSIKKNKKHVAIVLSKQEKDTASFY
jgi:hypothetical protein